MKDSDFYNKAVQPAHETLAASLGKTKKLFDEITSFIDQQYGTFTREWKFYSQKSGWTLKLLSKKRNVLFVIPDQGFFSVVFTFGDKAVNEILNGRFPEMIKDELSAAKKYTEGRGIRLEVKTKEECMQVLELVKIKMRN